MHEYLFDVKLFASIRVNAATEAEALSILAKALDCADCNAGSFPNGDPILFEASIDGYADLMEVDGELPEDDNPFHPESPEGRAYDRGDMNEDGSLKG